MDSLAPERGVRRCKSAYFYCAMRWYWPSVELDQVKLAGVNWKNKNGVTQKACAALIVCRYKYIQTPKGRHPPDAVWMRGIKQSV